MQKYFSFIILGAIGFGLLWPTPGLYIKAHVVLLLIIMMVLSCLNINLRDLKNAPKIWWRYLFVMGFIFLIPTFVVFCFKNFLVKDVYIGLVVAAAVPAGIASVALTSLMKGDTAKALIATILAHLISPIATPFTVWLFAGETIGVDFVAMIWLVAKLVIIPLIVAQIIRYFGMHKQLSKLAVNINAVLLIAIILGIVAPARNLLRNNLSVVAWVAMIILLIIILEISISIWFGRNKKENIAWSVVDVYKNFTLSSVIAMQMFGPLAVLGSVVYSVLDNIAIMPLQWWAKRRAR